MDNKQKRQQGQRSQRSQEQPQQYQSKILIRNNRLAAGSIFFSQTVFIFVHGYYVFPTATLEDQSLFVPTGIALLVLVGFGLVFSRVKNNVWGNLGFTLLITAYTFEFYFTVSGFWNIMKASGSFYDVFGGIIENYLSDTNDVTLLTYGVTAAGAFKCALSNVIIFAAISGRAGILEALMVSVVGTVGYQLNRQVISRYSFDLGGSMSIFCFAGCFGTALSLILYFCRQRKSVYMHPLYKASRNTWMMSLVGAAFCWVFFPFLSIDSPPSLFLHYTAGINALYAVSTSVVATIAFSSIVNGKIDLKDLVYSPIIGGVIVGSSSGLIFNVLGAMLLGIVAAFLQIIFNRVQKKMRANFFVSNNVFFVFAIQGLLGGLLSALFSFLATTFKSSQYSVLSYPYVLATDWTLQLLGTGISVMIGTISGLIVSIPMVYISLQTVNDHFHDRAYWILNEDGLSNYVHVHYSELSQRENTQHQLEGSVDEPQINSNPAHL